MATEDDDTTDAQGELLGIALDALRRLAPRQRAGAIMAALADTYKEDTHGLYEATRVAVRALLHVPARAPSELALAERVDAVGRGVEVRSMSKDVAPALRRLAELVERAHQGKLPALDHADPSKRDQAARLAEQLGAMYSRTIERDAIADALRAPSVNGRVADVAITVGLLRLNPNETPSAARNAAVKQVASALKRLVNS